MICQTTFYLVEQIDNLGENVEASSWIYWRLIEDTRLETRTESFLISVIYVIVFHSCSGFIGLLKCRICLRVISGDFTSCNTALFSRCWNGLDPLPTCYNKNMFKLRHKRRRFLAIYFEHKVQGGHNF